MNCDTVVDLEVLTDYEKAKIFQVLKRNSLVKDREERRLWHMAVREQIERLNDMRTSRHESRLKTKTGEWHKDMIRRRGKEVDVPSMLFDKISTDLMTNSGHSSGTSRSSSRSSLVQSTSTKSVESTSSKQSVESPRRCQMLGQTFDHDHSDTGMDMSAIKAWVDNQVCLDCDVRGARQNQKKSKKPEKLAGDNISLNIQPEEGKQRDI